MDRRTRDGQTGARFGRCRTVAETWAVVDRPFGCVFDCGLFTAACIRAPDEELHRCRPSTRMAKNRQVSMSCNYGRLASAAFMQATSFRADDRNDAKATASPSTSSLPVIEVVPHVIIIFAV